MFHKTIIFLFISVLFLQVLDLQAQTRWRGPNGNGTYNETGLQKKWPSAGPEILWSFEGIGEGHSSPVIANGTIYLSGMVNGDGYIFALTPQGKLKWKKAYGKEFSESYPGSRSTPSVDGEWLYIYSGHAVVTAMDAGTGEIKWKKDMINEYGGRNIRWGVTETLVIDEDNLIVTPGGKEHNIVALNRFTGDLVWSGKGEGETTAYCTPLLVELPKRKILVTHTAKNIIAVDAQNGELLWSHPQENRYDVHANTPIYKNGSIFCFSGYGSGGVMIELNDDGSKKNVKWENDKLDNRIGGMVEVDGYLYGSGDSNREWRCVDWETGTEQYSSKDLTKGVVIAADGMLYCYSERGELALVEANPEGFNINSETRVELGTAQHWSHPVISGNMLYLRHGNTLIAYKI